MIKKGKAYYLDNEELKKFSSILNKLLSKKYDWFKRIELESVRYQPTILNKGDDSTPLGKIYVDKEWGKNQWNKKWGSSFEDELGEIMFSDMLDFNLRYEIQNIFKLVFSSVVDVPYPRYTPFTWISVHPDDDKNNLQEQIRRVLKEETSKQSKVRDLIESKGIDLVSTMFGGFDKVAEILNLDVEDVDTQEWLVKNFIYHADFDEVDVSFIVVKTLSSGRRLLTIYFNSDSNASNIASWYVSEVCDYLNKELFPFKVNAPWRPNFIGNDLKIVLDGEVLDDDNEEELTEKWSAKYKRSINCNHPKGFSQKAHCAGRRKEMKEEELTEKCWKGYTQKGMKTMFGKRYPNCVKKTKK
jgi:hypothetical protein